MKSFLAEILVLYAILRCIHMKIRYNTYPEQISRATQHEPRVLRKSCLLKPDPGPCRANISMYHFNPEMKNCTTFQWGGCMGNGNRFDSEAECNNTCVSKPNEKKKRPRYCSLSFDYGYCFGAVTRWYYDSMWQVCKETIYSGCGGNQNNFYNIEQCEAICRLALGTLPEKGRNKGSSKKVIIINPWNTTIKRGKDQSNQTTTERSGNSTTI